MAAEAIRVGELTIHRIVEQEEPLFDPLEFFPGLTRETLDENRAWLESAGALDPQTGKVRLCIQSYLVRTPRHTTLVDTCVGNDKPRPARPFWNMLKGNAWERGLAATGVRPEDIDYVMCTHLHVDHVGWNTQLVDGRWVPTFPNARYLFGKREYAHWESERGKQGDGKVNDGSFDDSVLPIVEAGKAVMIDSDHQPDPLLTIKDYPGHTPGSIAINLKDGGRQACFSGDIMHHPIQVYHPDWSSQFCTDQEMSARSRRRLLEDCVESNALLCPAHFPGANAGYIKEKGDAFRIDWDNVK
jgi:glyoxylase-like metal-dependent hydrolase (beta-lactamase superfamily II)